MQPEIVKSSRNTSFPNPSDSSPASFYSGRNYSNLTMVENEMIKFLASRSIAEQQEYMVQFMQKVADLRRPMDTFIAFLKDFRKPDSENVLQPNYRILEIKRENFNKPEDFRRALFRLSCKLDGVRLEELRENCISYFKQVDVFADNENVDFSRLDCEDHFDLLHAILNNNYPKRFIHRVADSLKEKLLKIAPYQDVFVDQIRDCSKIFPVRNAIQFNDVKENCEITEIEYPILIKLVDPAVLLLQEQELAISTLLDIPDALLVDWFNYYALQANRIPGYVFNLPTSILGLKQLNAFAELCKVSPALSEKLLRTIGELSYGGVLEGKIKDFLLDDQLRKNLQRKILGI